MRGIARTITMLLIALMPLSASAQFVPIEEAKQMAALEEQSAVADVLGQIEAKGVTASRQVQVLLAEAESGRVGVSATQRKIDTLLAKFKTDLNAIVNEHAKKNPGAPTVKPVFTAAQETLNSVRRQAAETLDQVGFDQAADPKALTGKYKEYEEEIATIIEESLAKADERLEEPGRRDTVVADLTKLVDDTQRRIEIATTAFLSANPDVLSSALQRVKKEQLDKFNKAMAERTKTAKSRSNDKALDLTEDEVQAIEEASVEMEGMVTRAIQTIDSLMQQVAAANLPTSTPAVAGVNPLLEAKFKAVQQTRQIRRSINERLDKVKKRFNERTDLSETAQEVFNREHTRQKQRLIDTTKEYQTYFSAGDPDKKKYDEEVRRLQDEAEGCDSFFCDIGRIVGTVGSAVIKDSTGINISGQAISGGIFGISDGDPRAYRGAYSTSYGGYSTAYGGNPYNGGFFGGTGMGGIDPRCYASLPTFDFKKFAFVETAQAQGALEGETIFEGESAADAWSNRSSDGSSSSSSSSKSSGGLLGKIGDSFENVMKNEKYLRGISNTLNATLNRSLTGGRMNCLPTAGATSPYGGLPGYAATYNARFGGYPVAQAMGFQSPDLMLTGVDQDTYASRLAIGLEILVRNQNIPKTSKEVEIYNKVISVLRANNLTSDQKRLVVIEALQQTQFFTLQTVPGMNAIHSLFDNLCARTLTGDASLINLCRSLYNQAAGAVVDVNKQPVQGDGGFTSSASSYSTVVFNLDEGAQALAAQQSGVKYWIVRYDPSKSLDAHTQGIMPSVLAPAKINQYRGPSRLTAGQYVLIIESYSLAPTYKTFTLTQGSSACVRLSATNASLLAEVYQDIGMCKD